MSERPCRRPVTLTPRGEYVASVAAAVAGLVALWLAHIAFYLMGA